MTGNWRQQGKRTVLVLAAGLVLAYLLLVGKSGPKQAPPAELAPPLVDVVQVQPESRAIAVDTQGTVQPLRQVSVVSRVAGRVERVADSFAAGGFFQAGDELVKVEDVDYGFAIVRAESQVAAARQRLAEERGRALQAKREWRDLGSKEANALFLRDPQVASAEAALASAKADLAAAKLDLERTRIVLPFNGRITSKHVDVGQYLTPGTVVAEVYATDAVQVRLPLTDRQVALLDLPLTYQGEDRAAHSVPVTLSARFGNQEWEWQGEVVRTDASIDVDSRVVYAVAEVHKPFARQAGSERPPLAPGLFVHASIRGKALPDVTLLPRSALHSDDRVLLVEGGEQNERTVSRQVLVLQGDASQVWVQGLKRGERVVVREPAVITDGMRVTVNEVNTVAGVDP
jgi:RND family efflux transporter MFP subunit